MAAGTETRRDNLGLRAAITHHLALGTVMGFATLDHPAGSIRPDQSQRDYGEIRG
jgi:hypothetical protein